MSKGFTGIGHCSRCGDTIGPWTLVKGVGWVCDRCCEEVETEQFKRSMNFIQRHSVYGLHPEERKND